MSPLLSSPKGKIGAVAAGGLLVILALWFLSCRRNVRRRPRLAPTSREQAQVSAQDALGTPRPTSLCGRAMSTG